LDISSFAVCLSTLSLLSFWKEILTIIGAVFFFPNSWTCRSRQRYLFRVDTTNNNPFHKIQSQDNTTTTTQATMNMNTNRNPRIRLMHPKESPSVEARTRLATRPNRVRMTSLWLLLGLVLALSPSVHAFAPLHPQRVAMSCTTTTRLSEQANFYNDFEGYDSDESSDRRHNKKNNEDDDDEEDDDDYLSLTTTLQQRDWRDFRRQLAAQNQQDRDDDRTANKKSASQVSVENRDVLASQNRKLHGEYQTAVWAHEIAMVGWLGCS